MANGACADFRVGQTGAQRKAGGATARHPRQSGTGRVTENFQYDIDFRRKLNGRGLQIVVSGPDSVDQGCYVSGFIGPAGGR